MTAAGASAAGHAAVKGVPRSLRVVGLDPEEQSTPITLGEGYRVSRIRHA